MNAPNRPTPSQLPQPSGTANPAGDPTVQPEAPVLEVLPATVPHQADQDAQRVPRSRRPHPAPLPPKVRVGHDIQGTQPAPPPLPTTRQDLPLRDILQGLGPDMVATACHGINALNETGKDAKKEGNLAIRFMAEKTVAQEARKWSELSLGRTLNINQNIRSQRDVPRLDRLSTEKRAQLETLLSEMSSTEVLDIDFTNVDPHTTP